MSMQCYTNATSIMSTMITWAIVASIPILFFSLLIIIIANAIAISNLDAADGTAKNIFWLINRLTHLRGNFL